ncbi:MAG: DNA-processing protein DprA, partial [Desulfobacteraceae bacterium]
MATSRPDDILEWLTLQLVPGLGPVGCKNLISRFGSAESVFLASLQELSSVEGVREDVAAKILKKKRPASADRILRTVERTGARVLRITDQEYPPLLREIHDPPLLLYVRGREIPPALPFIAVVGSRNPTSYGTKAAGAIGQGLAVRGVGVVSGMAAGIDSAAHWGSMEQRGFPLAVLGTGIDVVYPESNKKLHEKLLDRGAVVSELVPGTPPEIGRAS